MDKINIITSKELKDSIAALPEVEKIHFNTFKKFDDILGGLEGGEIHTLGAFPGSGKTTFMISLTKDLSETANCLWFSCEMTPRSFISMFGDNIPLFHLPENIPTVNTAGERLLWLENAIKEAKRKYNTKVVFLDHLQYLTNLTTTNTVQMVDFVMRFLKEMCIRNDIVLFLITHLKKESDDLKRPSLDSMRGSQMIAGESFSVSFITRLKEKDVDEYGEHAWSNRSRLYIDKNRRGGKLGYIKLEYDYQTKRFLEL